MAAVGVGLVLAGILVFNADATGRRLEAWINSRLNGRLTMEQHRFSLAGPSLEIKDLRLSTDEDSPLVLVGRLKVALSLPAMIDRNLKISDIRLDDTIVDLATGPDGNLKLASILRRDKQALPGAPPTVKSPLERFFFQTVTADRIQINDLHLTHKTADRKIDLHCPALTLFGTAEPRTRSGSLTVDGRQLAITTPRQTLLIDGVEAKAVMRQGQIEPLVIKTKTPLGSLNIFGRIDQALTEPTAALSLTAVLDLAAIGDLVALKQTLSGAADLKASLTGELTDPVVRAELVCPRTAVGPLWFNLNLSGQAESGVIDLTQLSARAEGLNLCGHGRYTPETGQISARLELTAENIQEAAALAGLKNISGRLDMTALVRGAITDPTADLDVKIDGLELSPITIDRVTGRATLSQGTVTVQNLDLHRQNSQVQVVGSARLVDRVTGRFSSDPAVDFHTTRGVLDLADFTDGKLQGRAAVSARMKGTVRHPDGRLSGEVTFDRGHFSGQAFDDMSVAVDLKEQQLDLTVQGDVTATGRVDLRDMTFSAAGRLEKPKLAPWFALADHPALDGRLSARLSSAGKLTNLKHLTASAEIENLVLSHQRHGDVRTRPFFLDFREGSVYLPGTALIVAGQEVMDISGRLDTDGALSMAVVGVMPFAVPAMYLPEAEDPVGQLAVDARVSGTLRQPVVVGTCDLVDVGLVSAVPVARLHGIYGRIRLGPGEIRIRDIRGGLGEGRFQLSGTAGLAGYLPQTMDLRLRADALPVLIPDTMDLKLDADLALVMDGRRPSVRGEIVLLDGLYYQDAEIAGYADVIQSTFERKRALSPVSENPTPAFFQKTALDVTVGYRLPIKIDNNIASLTLQPDIAVQGSLANPVILGQARTDTGEIRFQDTVFEIENGVIRFDNPYKTDPHIDITARTTVGAWRIRLVISGTPALLEVSLASDPEEAQGDILSLLLFGKTTRDMNTAAGASQSPAQVLAGFLADQAAQGIKHVSGLDIVEISTTGSGEDNAIDGSITLGSRVTDRLSFKYTIKSGKDGLVQENASEYRLTENVTLSGFQDNQGMFGGRLIYRLEFR